MRCKTTNRSLLSVVCDARWLTIAGYASTDSVYVSAGNYSNLILGADAFSSRCNMCSRNIVHSPVLCAKNVEMHAKAMEAHGAKLFVLKMFNEFNCFVRELVADDDSSIRRILKHSFKDLFAMGLIEDVPHYDNGKKKPDNGELPANHISIHFFTDKNHRVRAVAKEIFAMVSKKKKCATEANMMQRG